MTILKVFILASFLAFVSAVAALWTGGVHPADLPFLAASWALLGVGTAGLASATSSRSAR